MSIHDGEFATRTIRSLSRMRIAIVCGLLLAIPLALGSPALAASLRGLMRQMNQTVRQAKPLLGGSFDAGKAQAILADFARQADESQALYATRSDAKAGDLRARFERLKQAADSALPTVKDKAGFQRAFRTVAQNCRSCHSVYR